jgi:hypothetical protein
MLPTYLSNLSDFDQLHCDHTQRSSLSRPLLKTSLTMTTGLDCLQEALQMSAVVQAEGLTHSPAHERLFCELSEVTNLKRVTNNKNICPECKRKSFLSEAYIDSTLSCDMMWMDNARYAVPTFQMRSNPYLTEFGHEKSMIHSSLLSQGMNILCALCSLCNC